MIQDFYPQQAYKLSGRMTSKDTRITRVEPQLEFAVKWHVTYTVIYTVSDVVFVSPKFWKAVFKAEIFTTCSWLAMMFKMMWSCQNTNR